MKWINIAGILALGSTSAMAAETVEREAETSSSPSVEIEIDSGYLEVKVWDRNIVRIEGTLDDSVEEWSFDASRDAVDIEIEDEDYRGGDWRGDWDESSDTELTLYVPKDASLSFDGINTSMTVEGLAGKMEAETVNGSIKLNDLEGDIDAASVNGSLDVVNPLGDLELGAVNGDITVSGATGSSLEASSVNGDIVVESSAADVEFEVVSGDIEAMLDQVERMDVSLVSGEFEGTMHLQEGGRMDVGSVSGDIVINLVEPINIRVDADSMSGDLDNRITDVDADDDGFIGKSLSFTTGNASARIEVSTVSGDLELRRAN